MNQPIDTTGMAAVRIELALETVERAQMLISEAAQRICPIRGLADEWAELVALHDQVQAYWHKLNDATNGKAFHLDTEVSG